MNNVSALSNFELLTRYDAQKAVRIAFRTKVFDLLAERDAALVDADLDSIYDIKVQTSKRITHLMDEFENAVEQLVRLRIELVKRGVSL